MSRQQKRQQSEVGFAVTVDRDIDGYEVKTAFATECDIDAARGTLAGGSLKVGDPTIEIVGRSGKTEPVTYRTNLRRPRIWTKLKNLTYPGDIASFMSDWGIIDGPPRRTFEYRSSLEWLGLIVNNLKHLAAFVESYDRDGFLAALGPAPVFHGTLIPEPTVRGSGLVGHVSSLEQFLVLEMWLDFGAECPARESIRTCPWCKHAFRAGGRIMSGSMRSDARYCSASCRNQASRARTKAANQVTHDPAGG
jgi:hypothetical protein